MNQSDLIIKELSEKLGTTSEYLWGVLISQAPIYAASWFITSLSFAVLIFYGYRVVKNIASSDDDMVFLWIIYAVVSCFVLVVVLMSMNEFISAIFNPEYWALNQLLH